MFLNDIVILTSHFLSHCGGGVGLGGGQPLSWWSDRCGEELSLGGISFLPTILHFEAFPLFLQKSRLVQKTRIWHKFIDFGIQGRLTRGFTGKWKGVGINPALSKALSLDKLTKPLDGRLVNSFSLVSVSDIPRKFQLPQA